MLARELMTSPIITITPEARLKEAMVIIDEHSITSMPVVDDQGRLVGVISEANLITEAVLPDERKHMIPIQMDTDPRPLRVADVMSHKVLSVDADDDVCDAVELMRATMVKSLPVLDGGQVVGMLSRSDIIHALATRDCALATLIEDLVHQAGHDWTVDVDAGVVTVTGTASDAEERLARGLAGSVAGVVAVHVTSQPNTAEV